MDKLAGLYTQIQILKKRLNSLDLSKEDPGNVAALSSDLTALEDRYTKISEAKKKRQQEKLSKDAPVTPEVTKEALPEADAKPTNVMDTKCESCGKPLGPEAFLSKWPVCGACTRKRHKDVTKHAEPEPSIADKLTNPVPTAPVVESAEELESKKKRKNCYHCGYYFPVGGSIVSHPCSHAAPGDTCPAATGGGVPAGAPAGGDGGAGGGAGAGAAGGGGAAASTDGGMCQRCGTASGGTEFCDTCKKQLKTIQDEWDSHTKSAAPTDAHLHKFSADDVVEPTKGTPGSWGSVLRHDGGPEDLVYVKWHGGPLKEMHSGYGGYTASDLRQKASLETDALKPKRNPALDAEIQKAVVGYQINIMDLSKVQQAGEAAFAAGQNVTEAIHTLLDSMVASGRAMKASQEKKAEAACVKCGTPVPYELSDKQKSGPFCSKCLEEKPVEKVSDVDKKEDLEVDAVKNSEIVQAFFNGATHGKTKNVSINQTNVGLSLWNYSTPIVLEKQGTYYFNTQKYSQTTSKLQNVIRFHLAGTKFKEVDEAGIREAMSLAPEKPRPPHIPGLQDFTPSMDLGHMPEPVKHPERIPLQVANLKLSATDGNRPTTQVADPTDPAEKGGVGYGGDRPGAAVAPARDVDVTLDAAIKCPKCGSEHIQKAEGYKLNKCLSCHLAFDNESAKQASLEKIAFVREEGGKWYVYSHKGKRLSKGYGSKEEANKRLREIEYFKHQGSMKLSSRDIKADVSQEITQQVEKIRERMTTFQEGLKTQASSGSDEAFKILKIDIEKLRQKYGDYPEAKEALDAIVYEMEQLTATPGTVPAPAAPVVEGAGSNIPPKPTTDPGLNMQWFYNDTTNTWEIKDKTI